MRLAVYTDYSYREDRGAVYAERAFVVFLERLAGSLERMVLLGRLDPKPGRSRYAISEQIEFVALPHYPSASRPAGAAGAWLRSLGRFWRVLGRADAVWLLGPHPLCVAFALLAAARRKRVVLGVRQDMPRYARSRHPGRRPIYLAADLLDGCYRALARLCPTVVVGPDLARNYRNARRLLEISVSLVGEGEIAGPEALEARSYEGELRVLSVGRLEAEKNPLLLAEVLARLVRSGRDWRLVVCGEGPLEEDLRDRLRALGVADRAKLRGYVPIDGGLLALYRESHALLHVSWTEGLPQVLFESFAARLPIVATAVGGVAGAASGAALLVPPGDPDAAARALTSIASDPALRARLTHEGAARVRRHTLEAECQRVTDFLTGLSR